MAKVTKAPPSRSPPRREIMRFRDLAEWSSRFAHWLTARGVERGDRVAVMLEPSLAFYAALFGAIKHGAIAVPLFTLFGPDGIRLRVDDCAPKLFLTNAEKADTARALDGLDVVVADDQFMTALATQANTYEARSAPDDLAVFQYTSGTTRELLAPLALGVTTGTMAGKFDPVRMLRALQEYEVTNLSAAATHYRMIKSSSQA